MDVVDALLAVLNALDDGTILNSRTRKQLNEHFAEAVRSELEKETELTIRAYAQDELDSVYQALEKKFPGIWDEETAEEEQPV